MAKVFESFSHWTSYRGEVYWRHEDSYSLVRSSHREGRGVVMIQGAAVVGAGLVGGVYTAFSVMIMPALGRGDDQAATTTMVAINRAAERGPFILIFGATALAAVGLAVTAVPRGDVGDLLVAGASLASTGITVAVNVPLNRRLEREGAAFWPAYHRRWTAANTIRAIAAIAAVGIAAAAGWNLTVGGSGAPPFGS